MVLNGCSLLLNLFQSFKIKIIICIMYLKCCCKLMMISTKKLLKKLNSKKKKGEFIQH